MSTKTETRIKTRECLTNSNQDINSENNQKSTSTKYYPTESKKSESSSIESIQDIHNNNKEFVKSGDQKTVPTDLEKGLKMAKMHVEVNDDKCEKTSEVTKSLSPTINSRSSSPPSTQFFSPFNTIFDKDIPKPLGLRIQAIQGTPSPLTPIPSFPHQAQPFPLFPWFYNHHYQPSTPTSNDRNINNTIQPYSKFTTIDTTENNSRIGSRYPPPPVCPILPPNIMNLNLPPPGGIELRNVFPPGIPLGRGHELMRRLCAMNPQFASSVLEDYIRPQVRDGDIVLEIECGPNAALLYLSRLCQGSKGPCIWFQDAWLTPNEFQYISGRETAKDWKRSIRHCGKSMKLLLTKGILTTHPPICDCDGCRISSPVVSS